MPSLIQFGYLSTTTGGMAFGLLSITIAALVSDGKDQFRLAY